MGGGNLPKLPSGIRSLTLPAARYSISPSDPIRFQVETQEPTRGSVCLVVEKQSADWQVAAVYGKPDDGGFTNLSPLLAPLDIVPIENFQLKYASAPGLAVPCPQVSDQVVELAQGIVLSGDLRMRGIRLTELKNSLGLPDLLYLHMAFPDVPDNLILDFKSGEINFLGLDLVWFKDTRLQVAAQPVALTLLSDVELKLFEIVLPFPLTMAAGITESSFRLYAQNDKPWENAFGLKGLDLQALVFQIEPPADYAFYAKIVLPGEGQVISVKAKLVGSAWEALEGELRGCFTLTTLMKLLLKMEGLDFVGNRVSIRDFKFSYAARDVTIGEVTIKKGIELSGFIGFFGLEVDSKLVIDSEKGIYARARLGKVIDVAGGVLKIYGATENVPPEFEIDTRSTPKKLAFVGGIKLLGLEAKASFNEDGLSVTYALEGGLNISLGGIDAAVHLGFAGTSPWDFKAFGDFKFGVHLKTDPIKEPNTHLVLFPAIDAEIKLDGSIDIVCNPKQLSSRVRFGFDFMGVRFKLDIALDTTELQNLPDLLLRYIQENSYEIFSQFFKRDPLSILLGLWEGLGRLGKEFWKALQKLGGAVADVWKAISAVDLYALPAIAALPLKAWQEIPGKVWKDAGDWSAEKWQNVASWGDDTWDKTKDWAADKWQDVINSPEAAEELFEKWGISVPPGLKLHRLVPGGQAAEGAKTVIETLFGAHTVRRVETGSPSSNCYVSDEPLDHTFLLDQAWRWESSDTIDIDADERISTDIPATANAECAFDGTGAFELKVDCIRAGGTFSSSAIGRIDFEFDPVREQLCSEQTLYRALEMGFRRTSEYFSTDRSSFNLPWLDPEHPNLLHIRLYRK